MQYSYLLRVHDSALVNLQVAHGNQGVIRGAESFGELVFCQRVAGKLGHFAFLGLTLDLKGVEIYM